MGDDAAKRAIQEILSPVGIMINGEKPWDLLVSDVRFYRRVLNDGSLGFGESYMDGWWECEDLAEFFCRLLPSGPESKIRKNLKLLSFIIQSRVVNPERKSKAFQIGEKHYDIGNELYKNMLDKRMIYSCAYWKDAHNLDDAQEAKLDLICRKIGLKSRDRILDIGCGWGGLIKYASEAYGVEAVGITVSGQQLELARERCKGLPVEIRLQDYRDIDETFDYVVSVGMLNMWDIRITGPIWRWFTGVSKTMDCFYYIPSGAAFPDLRLTHGWGNTSFLTL